MKLKFIARTGMVLTAVWLAVNLANAESGSKSTHSLQYDLSEGSLVATFHEHHPGFAAELQADERMNPLIRIYGDGRVLVHRPDYMKQPGEYELMLSPNEFSELLDSLSAAVAGFDTDAVQLQKKASVEARFQSSKDWRDFTIHAAPDASIAIFRLFPSNAPQLGMAGLEPDQSLRRSWKGLSFDAKHYPELEPIQNLAKVERSLHDLGQSARLHSVGGTSQ